MRILAALLSIWLSSTLADGSALSGSGGVNAAQHLDKPYLVLVSIDGFRWDYLDRHPTPNLDRLIASGSRADRLIPVFPTLTFPNHYSIATGLYPSRHGIVANEFPSPHRDRWYATHNRETVEDASFYAGEPIWVTAESQGMVSAAFFFVGTEAPIKGASPSHWYRFDKKIPGEQRVDQVLEWLAEEVESRPHMITLYFEDVDDHSHWYGPGAGEMIESVQRVDAHIGRLLDGIATMPHGDEVNVIVVSDHGQGTYIDDQEPFVMDEFVDIGNTRIIESGSYVFLYFNTPDEDRAKAMTGIINRHWNHGRAYLPGETPEIWQTGENASFPDLILIPDAGYAALSSLDKVGKINAGDHGWAPEDQAMHGIFIASGPNIRPGVPLGNVRNVDIYPLMTSILGLEPASDIDSDPSAVAEKLIVEH
jgi:predicted AlkP superfamily pyrophosphatase or phosphodiesterase